jgi:hypothetical protein
VREHIKAAQHGIRARRYRRRQGPELGLYGPLRRVSGSSLLAIRERYGDAIDRGRSYDEVAEVNLATKDRSIPIEYSSGDQVLASPGKGLYISTGGTLVVRLRSGNADTTLSGLVAGREHAFEVIKIVKVGSDAAGLILYGA